MMFRWQLRTVGWFLAFMCIIVTFGCEPSIYEPVGPWLPISDQRIINQAIGTPPMNSSIYELYDDGIGGFYYRGVFDGIYCLGTIDRNGQLGWVETFDDKPRGLYPLSENNVGLTEALISVGGIDTNDDDSIDEARALLIGSGGVIIDELIISKTDTALCLNSIDAIGPLSFVAVGWVKPADIYYPFVTTIEINPDSTLEMNTEVIFSDIANQYLLAVQVDAEHISGDDFLCYVSAGHRAAGDGTKSIAIHALTGSTSAIDVFDLMWTVEILQDEPLDIWSYHGNLVLHDGTLYLAGSADVEKENNPPDGYWEAGFISSLSTSGTLNWINMISISTHSENYHDLYATDDLLYAVGYFSSYYVPDSEQHFGLALLSIFDTVTGDEIYHLGFGNEEYSSGFNTLHVDGTKAFCGGYTHQYTADSGFRSWFTEIGIDNINGAVGSELPILMPAVEGAICQAAPYTLSEDKSK